MYHYILDLLHKLVLAVEATLLEVNKTLLLQEIYYVKMANSVKKGKSSEGN